eukprot:jgi/Botrbrau1/18741/Bobra.0386s0064.1
MSGEMALGLEPPAKRARSSLDPPDFFQTLRNGGLEDFDEDGNHAFSVQDERKLRGYLEQCVRDPATRVIFLQQAADVLGTCNISILRRLLHPLEVSEGVPVMSGDSLLRMLLSVPRIQGEISEVMLQRLPEIDAGTTLEDSLQLQRLLLSQFRWVDHLADGHRLTLLLLEVIDACTDELQKDIISFLPEVCPESDTEIVLHKLQDLCEGDSTFLVPVLEAAATLQLQGDLQVQVTDMALRRVTSVEVRDLPIVLQFVLQHALPCNVKEVVSVLRHSLLFANVNDPRLPALTLRDKAKGAVSAKTSLSLVIDALKNGFQLSNLASKHYLAEIRRLSGHDHRAADIWFLLIIESLGGPEASSAITIFKQKVCQGVLGFELLCKSITDRQQELDGFFVHLLKLAHMLIAAPSPEGQETGSKLSELLFKQFSSTLHRQEVLRSLQSHLGQHIQRQQSCALRTIYNISKSQTQALLPYAGSLSTLLDFLSYFSDSDLHQVFGIFSELVVQATTSVATGHGQSSRVVDDLHIVLRKQLDSADSHFKHIGIIGTVSLVRRLCAAANRSDLPSEVQDQCSKEAQQQIMKAFAARNLPESTLGVLCDELADLLEDNPSCLTSHVSEYLESNLLDFLSSTLLVDLEGGKVADQDALQGAIELPNAVLFNLIDDSAQVALGLLMLLTSTTPASRRKLAYMGPGMRLLGHLQKAKYGNLEPINVTLGCPIHLCDTAVMDSSSFASLPQSQKIIVVQSVYYAVTWMREVINAFSSSLPDTFETDCYIPQLLIFRLQTLCQLESVFLSLVDVAPATLTTPWQTGEIICASLKVSQIKRASGQKKGGVQKLASRSAEDKENCSDNIPRKNSGVTSSQPPTQSRLLGKDLVFRPLRLPTLKLVTILTHVRETASIMGPAALLLAELSHHVPAVLSSRPPAPFTAQAQSQGRPLFTVGPVLEAFLPELPALHSLLQMAHELCLSNAADDNDLSILKPAILTGSDESELSVPELDWGLCAATEGLEAGSAAFRVILNGLSILSSFARFEGILKPPNRKFLFALLQTFQPANSDSTNQVTHPVNASPQFLGQIEGICKFVESLTLKDGDFTKEMTVVETLQSLAILAQRIKVDNGLEETEVYTSIRGRVSRAAGSVLEQDWDSCLPTHATGSTSAFTWKSQSKALAKLLTLYITYDANPHQTLHHLCEDVMPNAGNQQTLSDVYPSLSKQTVSTWYKVLCDQLVSVWDGKSKQLSAAVKSSAQNDRHVRTLLMECGDCAKTLACLTSTTKGQPSKAQILVQAVRTTSRAIDSFVKNIAAWRAVSQDQNEGLPYLVAIIKDMQKATRQIQCICSDAKFRKDLQLTSKVPAVKRSLERFVYEVKGLFAKTQYKENFWMGNLRHKDATGKTVGSQACDDASEDEDEPEEMQVSDDEAPASEVSDNEADESQDGDEGDNESNEDDD